MRWKKRLRKEDDQECYRQKKEEVKRKKVKVRSNGLQGIPKVAAD